MKVDAVLGIFKGSKDIDTALDIYTNIHIFVQSLSDEWKGETPCVRRLAASALATVSSHCYAAACCYCCGRSCCCFVWDVSHAICGAGENAKGQNA